VHSENVSPMAGATSNLGQRTNQQGDGNNHAAGNHGDSSFVTRYRGVQASFPAKPR
jgi:hypothetical protein